MEYDIRQLRLFPYDTRLRPLPVPDVNIFAEPLVGLCLNAKWASHLDGLLERLLWEDAWEGTPNEIEFAQHQIRLLMAALYQNQGCEGTMNYRLRQNPTNSCQLQQSFDGGNNWVLAFDYSLCRPRLNSIDITNTYNNSQTEITNNLNEWNDAGQTINNYAPNVVHNGNPAHDANIDAALCLAVQALMEVLETAIYERFVNPINSGLFPALVGAIVTAGATAATGGAAFPAFAGAVAGVLTTAASYLAGALGVNEFNAVRDQIRDCIYCNLYGDTISQAGFSGSYNACDLTGITSEQETAFNTVINALLANPDVFLAFVKLMAEFVPLAQAGIITNECGCNEAWVYKWDFLTSDGGWYPNAGGNQGAWVLGQGIVMQTFDAGGGNVYTLAQWYKNVPTGFSATSMSVEVDAVLGGNRGGRFVVGDFSPNAPNLFQNTQAGLNTYTFDLTNRPNDGVLMAFARASHDFAPAGSGRIVSATLSGNGEPPALTGGQFL